MVVGRVVTETVVGIVAKEVTAGMIDIDIAADEVIVEAVVGIEVVKAVAGIGVAETVVSIEVAEAVVGIEMVEALVYGIIAAEVMADGMRVLYARAYTVLVQYIFGPGRGAMVCSFKSSTHYFLVSNLRYG